jgi:hypothetical protein
VTVSPTTFQGQLPLTQVPLSTFFSICQGLLACAVVVTNGVQNSTIPGPLGV